MIIESIDRLPHGITRFYATCGSVEVWMDFDKEGKQTDSVFKRGTNPSISLEVACRKIAKEHNMF